MFAISKGFNVSSAAEYFWQIVLILVKRKSALIEDIQKQLPIQKIELEKAIDF